MRAVIASSLLFGATAPLLIQLNSQAIVQADSKGNHPTAEMPVTYDIAPITKADNPNITTGYKLENLEVYQNSGTDYRSIWISFPRALVITVPDLPNGIVTRSDTSSNVISFIVDSTKVNSADIENWLSQVTFTKKDEKAKVAGDLYIKLDEREIAARVDEDGVRHYYERINQAGINWVTAYNAAKSKSYKGLKGYLVTITSPEEQDFLYTSISTVIGWAGGINGVDENGEKLIDRDTMPEVLKGSGTTTGNYWVNGPEAGLTYNTKSYSEARNFVGGNSGMYQKGADEPFEFYKNTVTPMRWDFKPGSTTDKMMYATNPNTTGFREGIFNNSNAVEPNGIYSGTPQALQYAYGTSMWNDHTYTATLNGFYVEYSEYGDQKEIEMRTTPHYFTPGVSEFESKDDFAGGADDKTRVILRKVIGDVSALKTDGAISNQGEYIDLEGKGITADQLQDGVKFVAHGVGDHYYGLLEKKLSSVTTLAPSLVSLSASDKDKVFTPKQAEIQLQFDWKQGNVTADANTSLALPATGADLDKTDGTQYSEKGTTYADLAKIDSKGRQAVYMIVEENTGAKDIFQTEQPMLLRLPAYDSYEDEMSVVYLYPKNEKGTISKEVNGLIDADKNGTLDSVMGQLMNYTITVPVPTDLGEKTWSSKDNASVFKYTNLVIKDTPEASYDSETKKVIGEKLQIESAVVNAGAAVLSEDDNMSVAITKDGLTVTIAPGKFQEIIDANTKELVVTVKAYIPESKVPGQVYGNKAYYHAGDFEVEDESNEVETGSISLVKKDGDSGVTLAGAKFVVKTKSGQFLAESEVNGHKTYTFVADKAKAKTFVSDNNGRIVATGLPITGDGGAEQYELEEIEAPNGYILDNKNAPQAFDVVSKTAEKEIKNYHKGLLPSTGGKGIILYILSGLMGITILAIVYRKLGRKAEKVSEV